MTDIVDIYNQAISAVGGKSLIVDPNEESKPAQQCSLWYDHIIQVILSAAPWSMATAYSRLALLATRDTAEDWVAADPDPGYVYVYSAPQDMIRPRYITDFQMFIPTNHDDKRAIATNKETPILVYTKDIKDNPNLWDIALTEAIVAGLAAAICLSLTGKVERRDYLAKEANRIILDARAQHANNMVGRQVDNIPDWIAARSYAESAPPTRYLYPNGNLLNVTTLD